MTFTGKNHQLSCFVTWKRL